MRNFEVTLVISPRILRDDDEAMVWWVFRKRKDSSNICRKLNKVARNIEVTQK